MARTQKNKATSYHLGLLKAKLAKLKREIIDSAGGKKGGQTEGFGVTKSGDARIGLVGFPSVGKSTLLNQLTSTESKVAAYEFTTLTCIPGNINYKGSKIQLLDLPGIIEGAKDGKGRGKQVIAVARTCNLICIVLDATRPIKQKALIEAELEGFGIRLNKEPPGIVYQHCQKGGIIISRSEETPDLDDDVIRMILKEYKINNCQLSINQSDVGVDEIIDVIEGNRKYIPCVYALNKIDDITLEELEVLDRIPHYTPISAHLQWNLDELIEAFWQHLDMIRIYPKPHGEAPDYESPVVLQRTKSSIECFCNRIHRNMIKEFKYALVWGSSVKHNPQKVGKDHILLDDDIVQIIKK